MALRMPAVLAMPTAPARAREPPAATVRHARNLNLAMTATRMLAAVVTPIVPVRARVPPAATAKPVQS